MLRRAKNTLKKLSGSKGGSSSGNKAHGFVGSEDEWEDYDDYMDDYEYWEYRDVDDEDDWDEEE